VRDFCPPTEVVAGKMAIIRRGTVASLLAILEFWHGDHALASAALSAVKTGSIKALLRRY